MENKSTIIELKHIKKCYNKNIPVIYDFNLKINEGEFVTFLGPSGCGKTTILRMIAGFEKPTSGNILFQGKDISDMPPNERKINTVFQRYALFPHLNVYDNIAFGLKLKKMPKAEIEKKVKKVLEMVDLEGFEHRKVSTLSGGQQQRIAIARALCAQTKIILFDEPTSALDPETIQEVLDVMIKLAKENITMVVVTHEMGFARQVADRVVFMADGQIIEEGTPDHFFDNPSNERVKQFLGKIIR